MRRVSVGLSEDMYEVLRRASENRNVTISSIIRKALEHFISRYPDVKERCIETKRIRVCG